MEQAIAVPEDRWNTPMKVMVIGHARHGKDTVGELLKRLYGLSSTSSSLFCAERIMLPYFNAKDLKAVEDGSEPEHAYLSAEECYEDRASHRKEWHDQITSLCEGDLSRLVREIFETNDVYCGCRNDREFLQAKGEGLFNFSLWVDRSLHLPAEKRDIMKLERWMADEVVDNNGSLADLERNLIRIVNPFVVAFRSEWRRLRAERLR